MPPRTRKTTTGESASPQGIHIEGISVSDSADRDLFEETEPKVSFTDSEPEMPDGPRRRQTKISKELESMYAAIGASIYMFNPRIGATIAQQAKPCAESLDELARTNPAIRKALERMLVTTAWSATIAAHMPIIVAVATEYVPHVRETYEAAFNAQNEAADTHDNVHTFPNGYSAG